MDLKILFAGVILVIVVAVAIWWDSPRKKKLKDEDEA
jgi:hypothetical protein